MTLPATRIKSHPILFKGEMVKAILEGRKTQTRRIAKHQPFLPDAEWVSKSKAGVFLNDPQELAKARYKIGDRLWVQETLYRDEGDSIWWRYKADDAFVLVDDEQLELFRTWSFYKKGNTCVSIHAPRWSSRITLEILDVRLQTLQSISEEDAIAEGVGLEEDGFTPYITYEKSPPLSCDTAYLSFHSLWVSINGIKSWDDNPWVWAYKFRRLNDN